MKSVQYTIRNIPEPVNRYLRKKSRLSGKSLNQVVIDELSARVAPDSDNVAAALDWFIGSGIDNKTMQALEDEDDIQKELVAKELSK